ncbi:SDR family NAD(P)-dependent oxidoreductase [Pantoea vagans]|uniref:SDR family NAD(P)-dependent oxidoreductase n=1 Tax=Pantoea vagans TaxID=470934 RepID=UPI003B027D19
MQKTILITGCSSGIGLVAAHDLLARGYKVIAACRKADDVARMNTLGYTGIQLDLDDPQSVAIGQRMRCSRSAITVLAALFNNAGFGLYGPARIRSRVSSWSSSFPATFSASIS